MKPSPTAQLTIGRLATQAGIGIEAIRFYERKGIMPKPQRSAAGYRQYTHESVQRLQFIQRAKDLGFTLADIQELLNLRIKGQSSCRSVQRKTQKHLETIATKIADLRRMQRTLGRLLASCDANAPTSQCPILDALEHSQEKRP